jgi:pimeloyl-ACP methyl ester carboxylesterase
MVGRLIMGVGLAVLASCGSPAASSQPAGSAPVGTAVHVAWGRIGYRSVGHGPALVLLIGGGGAAAPSIDNWPPALVDRLAHGHRVLAMDYEGVGRTTLRPGPLSIDRLADDTADFIRAMHLRRADVLGWSMGAMVAQALAIRHPRLVRRLVLCSAALGDGSAKLATVGGQQRYPGEWLFPLDSNNRARAAAYERAIHSYPHYYEGSSQIAAAQGDALFLWLRGYVRDGHDAAQITAPTLVGGGSRDVLLPLPDSRDVARAIPHAKLQLYSDAGHGFLVQHLIDWSRRVERFLGQSTRPG